MGCLVNICEKIDPVIMAPHCTIYHMLLSLQLETPFHSTALTPGMANRQSTFRCTVRFEGTNVLEGIRNLAEVGIAELPMKPHLSKLNCMGKNVIVLKHRAAANVTQSTVTQ